MICYKHCHQPLIILTSDNSELARLSGRSARRMFRLMVINVLNNKRKLKMVTVSATISFLCEYRLNSLLIIIFSKSLGLP